MYSGLFASSWLYITSRIQFSDRSNEDTIVTTCVIEEHSELSSMTEQAVESGKFEDGFEAFGLFATF